MTGRTHYTASGARSHHRKGRSRKQKRSLSDRLAAKRPWSRAVAAKSPYSVAERVEVYKNREVYANRILGKALVGALPDEFGRRTIHQKGWSLLSSLLSVETALDYLVERGCLRRMRIQGRGRPKIVYALEPVAPDWHEQIERTERFEIPKTAAPTGRPSARPF